MKRFALAALAVITLLGFTGCDLLGSTTDKPTSGGDTDIFSGTGKDGGASTWWLKGSYDGWKQNSPAGNSAGDDFKPTGADTHFFSVDSLNPNLIAFTMTASGAGLRQNDYEFVVMSPDPAGVAANRVKYAFVYDATTTKFADNTVYTLVPASTAGSSNIKFTATATSYTIKIDITNEAAPKIKLVPGTTAATAFTEQELAEGLVLKGSAFDVGWGVDHTVTTAASGSKDGVYDSTAHTVTFNNMTAIAQNGEFGVDSLAGWMTVPNIAANEAAPVTATFVSGGTNPVFTPVGNSDAKYRFVIGIDSSKTVAQGRYTFTVTVTDAGTTAWPGAPLWTTVTTTPMTSGAGAGNSWGAQLGTIGTAVSGSNLVVKVTFSGTDVNAHNLWMLLDNTDVSTGSSTLTGDLTTGWGAQNLANTAALNYDFVAWGWGSGKNGGGFNYSGANKVEATTTDVKSDVSCYEDAATSTIWFQIPLTALQLDASHNHLSAVVLWGDNGNIRSVIPAITPNSPVTDITAVASTTLSGL